MCVKHLGDLQLAFVLARLGEPERGPVTTHLLRKVRMAQISDNLGTCARRPFLTTLARPGHCNRSGAHGIAQVVLPRAVAAQDRWLASVALWLLGERDAAKEALLTKLESLLHADELEGPNGAAVNAPMHPSVARGPRGEGGHTERKTSDGSAR